MEISLGGFTWETYHTTYIHVHNTVLRYYLVLIIKEASTLSEEDKVQFKSYLSKRTDRRFREFVAQKNPLFLKGQLSCEAERALIEYMDRRGPAEFSENRTRTHISTNMCTSGHRQIDVNKYKAEQLIEAISSWVMKQYNQRDPPTEIPHEMLRKAIIAVKGVQDRRSVNAAIELLKANGLLTGITDKLYSIPYNTTSTPPPAPPVERGTFREV